MNNLISAVIVEKYRLEFYPVLILEGSGRDQCTHHLQGQTGLLDAEKSKNAGGGVLK